MEAGASVIKTTFTPTGDNEADKARVEEYAKLVNMNQENTKAGIVLATQGTAEFIKHVFTGQNGEQLSYAEMRSRYG